MEINVELFAPRTAGNPGLYDAAVAAGVVGGSGGGVGGGFTTEERVHPLTLSSSLARLGGEKRAVF
jgi:hypothetical protein